MNTKTMSQFEMMDTEMLALKVILEVGEICFLLYWVG